MRRGEKISPNAAIRRKSFAKRAREPKYAGRAAFQA
jgi:hypothetical protein